MTSGPLTGFLVIDLSTILAGPLACQILGDFGADVVKIEHPGRGDGMRGHGPAKDGEPLWWKEISRNKRTVGLSLSDPDGAAVFLRLAATADVVVENFRPGTLERWGVGPDRLHEVNPGLVLVRITGFGQTGPYAARPGLRHPRRGDERVRPPDRPGRRPADAARLRAGRLDRRDRRLVGGLDGVAGPRAQRRSRPGRRPQPARADHDGRRSRPHRLRPDRRRRDPARQPVRRTTHRATPTRPPMVTGSRSPPAPSPSPSGSCASSGTPRWSTSRGSPPATPGRSTPTSSTRWWAAGSPQRTRRRRPRRVHRGRRGRGPRLQRPRPGRGPARAGDRHADRGQGRRPRRRSSSTT